MASKNSSNRSSAGGLTALKIGTRLRCTDDSIEGRITWANGTAVKIQWDDGEQVTWRRDTLADRPIEILPSSGSGEQATVTPEPADPEQGIATPQPANDGQGVATALSPQETATTQPAAEESTPKPELPVVEKAESALESTAAEPASSTPETADGQPALATTEAAETPAPSKQRRKAPAVPKEKKLSALDAAAKVLAETGTAMTCQEMVAVMAQKGYWTSPGGRTPAATLCSAVLREISTKGSSSRFVKVQRGQFGRSGVV